MAIDEVYLCKDCKFSRMSWFNNITTLGGRIGAKSFMYKCSNATKPGYEVIDPVSGLEKVKAAMPYCTVERTTIGYRNTKCGPTAKYWKPKNKKDLFKTLTKDYDNAD
jgi:hypothetical protein